MGSGDGALDGIDQCSVEIANILGFKDEPQHTVLLVREACEALQKHHDAGDAVQALNSYARLKQASKGLPPGRLDTALPKVADLKRHLQATLDARLSEMAALSTSIAELP